MKIRPETTLDHTSIYKINHLAFGQKAESQLINRLRKTDEFIPELSLVMEKDNTIIGHILFSKIKIVGEKKSYSSLALAPMSVHPDYQKQGVGSQLVRAGLAKAKEMEFDSVIVLGHKNYYPRFGFEKASKWGVKCPFEVPEEVFMGLELVEGGLKDKVGIVEYSKAFAE